MITRNEISLLVYSICNLNKTKNITNRFQIIERKEEKEISLYSNQNKCLYMDTFF